MPLSITTSSDYLSLECNRYLSILYKIIGDDLTELCCDIASALEKYLKRPKSLVQKFQRIYEVNTSSKEGRIDLQEDIINNSEFNKRLEFLEECICQIDRQTDERHRQVIYLKKCAQQVKKKMDSPEQAQCFFNRPSFVKTTSIPTYSTKPCIDSESLKYRQEEYNNKTRRDPVLDKTNVLIKKVEDESCEGQTTFKHTRPSYRLQPHLESLKACEDFGIRKCNERNSSVIGTFEHPIAFPTIKSKSMDRRSLNRLDPSVVYLRSATNDRCKLAHSSSSYVGITENNSILVSQSPSVDTVSQISVKERGANLSQRKSQNGTSLSTNKKEDHRIRQLTNPQIKEGDSLAKPHTHEGKKLPTIMNKNHNEYFSKPATKRKITVAPEQRKAQLPSRYFIPFTKTVAYSKVLLFS
ncbi:unnamed protein product [Mytilus edulis]|uniref:Uncharacterized protein n=1 Tax=Mytilus edulis TaxID=6550 RepID=A0A8S3Q8E4_MYTED|nr:unnamed protein product [Mytilus edulis]